MSQKLFKIEQQFASITNDNLPGVSPQQHNQLMSAIAEVKDLLSENSVQTEVPTQIMEDFRSDMAEAAKIKAELIVIQKAIDSTKYEIAALHLQGEETPDIARMSDELDAIVTGTENATETILTAVEQIDDNANDLGAMVRTNAQRDMASDIQDQVVKIFEACNFQDLTGQRISKVIRAFGFIDQRVDQMMEIWGGIDSFKGFEPEEIMDNGTDHHLLNGPSLVSDADVANQDDIDALFD
ncbi:MAG: protein phosphatase CheZ [bacterium]|nr:protein phosphatase CheZ [bacterium]